MAAAIITQTETGEISTGQIAVVVVGIITEEVVGMTEDGVTTEVEAGAMIGEVVTIEALVMKEVAVVTEIGITMKAEIMLATEAGLEMIAMAEEVGVASTSKKARLPQLATFRHQTR